MASDGSFYDPAKLQALLAQIQPGADGRKVLGNDAWMQLLNPISGLILSQAAQGPGWGGVDQDQTPGQAAIYKDSLGRTYRDIGNGQVQYFDNSGAGFKNPTGGDHDYVQPTYSLGADGTATPVSSGANYSPSTWVSSGRDAAKILGSVLAAGAGGAALGAGEAGAGAGAGVAADGAMPAFAGNAAGTSLGGGGIASSAGAQAGALAGSDAAGGAALGGGTNLFGSTIPANYAAGDTWGSLAAGAGSPSAGQLASGATGASSYMGPGSSGAGAGSDAIVNGSSATGSGSYGNALTQLMQNGVGKGLAGLGAAGVGAMLNGGGNLNVPNYNQAATAQGQSGRTDQSNPWANLSYTQNGVDAQGNPIYKQNVSLNPADQANLDQARQGQSSALTGLNNSIGGYADAIKGLPGLYGDAGSQSALTQQAIDSAYHQQAALLDPQYQKNQDALTSQLANQGVTQGSAAWQQAQDEFARQRDYAYGNARDSSISQGNALANQLFNQNLQAHQTGMGDLSTQQNQYLNNANGLGNVVKQPTFATPPTSTNYLGAAALQGQGNLNQYNAKIGNTNSLNNGLFSLGGAVLSNPTWTNAIGNLFSTGGGG